MRIAEHFGSIDHQKDDALCPTWHRASSVIVRICFCCILVRDIAKKDAERFVLDHSALKSRPNASAFQRKNVEQWLRNANHPITKEEISFLDQHEDLIPLVSKQRTPLRRFIDKFDLLKLAFCVRNRKVRLCTCIKPACNN